MRWAAGEEKEGGGERTGAGGRARSKERGNAGHVLEIDNAHGGARLASQTPARQQAPQPGPSNTGNRSLRSQKHATAEIMPPPGSARVRSRHPASRVPDSRCRTSLRKRHLATHTPTPQTPAQTLSMLLRVSFDAKYAQELIVRGPRSTRRLGAAVHDRDGRARWGAVWRK